MFGKRQSAIQNRSALEEIEFNIRRFVLGRPEAPAHSDRFRGHQRTYIKRGPFCSTLTLEIKSNDRLA